MKKQLYFRWYWATAATRSPSAARRRSYTTRPKSSFILHFFVRVSIYAFPSHISVVATIDAGIRYWTGVFASYSLSNLHSVISRQNKQCFLKSNVLPNVSLWSRFDKGFDSPWGFRFWDNEKDFVVRHMLRHLLWQERWVTVPASSKSWISRWFRTLLASIVFWMRPHLDNIYPL